MTTSLLEVNNLRKNFENRAVISAISFCLQQGQTLGLVGPNGAGKSTTVSIICGLQAADQGDVWVNGKKMALGKCEAKQTVGLVPQDLAIYEDLTARQNLNLFGALYGLSGAILKSRCTEVLQLVNLLDRAEEKPSTFSGGMKRRLNIAAALLHQPRLLILDEPTVGVDPQSRNAIFDCLEVLKRQGLGLIYTSHYMEEVERLADHIIIMDHGKIIANETPAQLFKRLPAQAALTVEFAESLADQQISLVRAEFPGVTRCESSADGKSWVISLASYDLALPLLNWFSQRGNPPLNFSTAKTHLEDIFLTLTGHQLRD